MAVDASQPGSPGWWLVRLAKRLGAQRGHFDTLDDYYTGEHPVHGLSHGDERTRAYRRFAKRARTNFVGMVAESVIERLTVDGFRSGSGTTDEEDSDAWQVWQANGLDAVSTIVHRSAVVMGLTYVIVGTRDDGTPLITAEDPRAVTHEPDPTDWLTPQAALKVWHDEVAGAVRAIVYLPDTISYFVSTSRSSTVDPVVDVNPSHWSIDTEQGDPLYDLDSGDVDELQPDDGSDDDDAPLSGVSANPLGQVPVVPFLNRPRLTVSGYIPLGEFEDVLDVQDRINTVMLDRMVISKMQAYRQRWVSGLEPEEDDNGNPVRPFDPDVTALWVANDPETKFGDFAQSDLTGILKAVEADVQYLSAVTRTPPQYMLGQIVNASGDALEAAEVGLTSKVCERQRWFGYSWETVMRLAGAYAESQVDSDAEVIWGDPVQRTITETTAAAVQALTAGVPWRTRMRMLGFTPQEIARMEAERLQEALQDMLAPPAPTEIRLTEAQAVPPTGQQMIDSRLDASGRPVPAGTPQAPPPGGPGTGP